MKKSLFLLAILFSTSFTVANSILPAGYVDELTLGTAFSSLEREHKNIICVTGEETVPEDHSTPRSGTTQVIETTSNLDFNEIITGENSYSEQEYIKKSNFRPLDLVSNNKYSKSFLILTKYESYSKSLNNVFATSDCIDLAATINSDPTLELSGIIGDSYVETINYGAYFAAIIEIDFVDETSFNLYADDIVLRETGFDISGELAYAGDTEKNNIQVSFFFLQEGGQHLNTSSLLHTNDLSCNLLVLTECDLLVTDIMTYSTHSFSSQLNNRDSYGILSYNLVKYRDTSINDVYQHLYDSNTSSVDAYWALNKSQLFLKYSELSRYQKYLESILINAEDITRFNIDQIYAFNANLDNDLAQVKSLLSYCYHIEYDSQCTFREDEYRIADFYSELNQLLNYGFGQNEYTVYRQYNDDNYQLNWLASLMDTTVGDVLYATQSISKRYRPSKYGTYLGRRKRTCYAHYDLKTDYYGADGNLIETVIQTNLVTTFQIKWRWYQQSHFCHWSKYNSKWSERALYSAQKKLWNIETRGRINQEQNT